jgi:hypothetical protein
MTILIFTLIILTNISVIILGLVQIKQRKIIAAMLTEIASMQQTISKGLQEMQHIIDNNTIGNMNEKENKNRPN